MCRSRGPEPVCIRCRQPVGALAHVMGCSKRARACFECDHVWEAAAEDATETCRRCGGVGEPPGELG